MRRRRQKRAIAAQKVSIHASVKDATRRDSRVAFHLPSFNPRICKRCDRRDPRVAFHLPGFNPRICKRCDQLFHFLLLLLFSFNPRICKRCDFDLSRYGNNNSRFNPRICKRCDSAGGTEEGIAAVSIHASVKDATLSHILSILNKMFQSTHL